MRSKSRAVANVALALASCLVGLTLVEAVLRSFFPKYEHVAAPPFIRDPILGWVREPNRRGSIPHPDTGERHPFHHNNFGSRQHRNFSAADLESSVNVGFFGDSFTENPGMEAHFSFTEPLDHLLNVNVGEGGFNVLNFGVWSHGTAQSLLRYETWELRGTLDHVFYVYFQNDLGDNLAFHLDDAGQPKWAQSAPNPFALLARLHVSHLALEAFWGLFTNRTTGGFNTARPFQDGWSMLRDRHPQATHSNFDSPRPTGPYTLFRQLLRRFKMAAEDDGASFQLVRLPETHMGFSVATIVAEEGVETVSLQNCFAELDPAHSRTPWLQSPYRFRRNRHWNEAGNRLAAVCLHRFLAGRLGLPPMSDHEVARVLDRYYAAFEASAPGVPADPAAAAIRAKYEALRGDGSADPPGIPAPWTPSPDKLVIRSRFDVYLYDGWLAYGREDCRPSDAQTRFFLHVVPQDLRDLSLQRLPSGFDNLDFGWFTTEWTDDPRVWLDFDRFQWQVDHHFFQMVPATSSDNSDEPSRPTCLAYKRLPRYAIERIRTGQFVSDEGKRLWEGEHVLPAALPTPHSMP